VLPRAVVWRRDHADPVTVTDRGADGSTDASSVHTHSVPNRNTDPRIGDTGDHADADTDTDAASDGNESVPRTRGRRSLRIHSDDRFRCVDLAPLPQLIPLQHFLEVTPKRRG